MRPPLRGLLKVLAGSNPGTALPNLQRHLVCGHWVLAFPDDDRWGRTGPSASGLCVCPAPLPARHRPPPAPRRRVLQGRLGAAPGGAAPAQDARALLPAAGEAAAALRPGRAWPARSDPPWPLAINVSVWAAAELNFVAVMLSALRSLQLTTPQPHEKRKIGVKMNWPAGVPRRAPPCASISVAPGWPAHPVADCEDQLSRRLQRPPLAEGIFFPPAGARLAGSDEYNLMQDPPGWPTL